MPPLPVDVHSSLSPPLNMNNADSHQFPYHFRLLESELTSPVAETGEADLFSDLNQPLAFSVSRKVTPLDLHLPSEVPKLSGGSPQSILGGIGSWSGRSSNQSPLQSPSPPATSYDSEYDTARLIYAAARQVEILKMNTERSFKGQFGVVSNMKSDLNHIPPVQNHKAADFLAESRRAYNAALLYEHHLKNLNNSIRQTRSVAGQFTQSSWPSVQHQKPRVPTKANFQSAPLPRKQSVGTGVFLPRRYNTAPATPPRKRVMNTSDTVPAKVVQALNISFEEMNCGSQPHYSAYAASMSQKNYEALMARRNAFLVAQQQRALARADDLGKSNLEVCLPQEWSY